MNERRIINILEGKNMQDHSVEKESQEPYNGASAQHQVPGPDLTPETLYQPVPEQAQTPPPTPPVQPRRSGGGLRAGAILIVALVLLLVLGVGLFAGWQFGRSGSTGTGTSTQPGSSVASVQTQSEQVAATFKPSVVQINITTQKGGGLGSGTIIDNRGYIVTNNHVVEGAKQIQVELYDGTILPAQLTGTDPPDDLAVIKITPPQHMAVATIGDSSQLKVAEYVMAIGNPLGITQTVTSGIVSALGRNVPAGPDVEILGAIQTDAAINPGNSGGALVDLKGDLIGVPTLTIINPEFNSPASGVGFAIPSNRVKLIVPQLINTGSVTHTGRASLGVSVGTVDPTVAAQANLPVDYGALIVSVTPNGPAASAGLQPNDVIVQVDNKQIMDVASLGDALASKSPGDTVIVKAYRGNQQMTFNVKLGELQVAG
ncbi:MAG: PDZ domain-containing protein [Chloroflexi bacterium]|nr:MAG: PDZ domain-containing protein [Chloroflexota bacterium]